MNVILSNRRRYEEDKDAFSKMELAYLNVLLWAERKSMMPYRLDGVDELDSAMKKKIIGLASEGKFWSITRSRRDRRLEYRKGFLDLVELFVDSTQQYDHLMGRLEAFVDSEGIIGMANVTGLLSSLRPDIFMPYNNRSVYPFRRTAFEYLVGMPPGKYREFNDLYLDMARSTDGEWDLIDLDTMANDMYQRGTKSWFRSIFRFGS